MKSDIMGRKQESDRLDLCLSDRLDLLAFVECLEQRRTNEAWWERAMC